MKRPKATDYNLNNVNELVDFIQAWNEYGNLQQFRIYELENQLSNKNNDDFFYNEDFGYIQSNN